MGKVFSSFSNRDFRFLWSYFALSFMATNMEFLALGWLVLDITGSAFWVGAVVGLKGVGQVTFGLIGGVIADRFNRRVTLAMVQVLRATAFLIVGLLVISNQITLWHLMVLGLFQGMFMSVVLPTGEALVYDTVGPRRLLNAIAVKMGAMSLASIPGSLIAGTIIGLSGPGPCFLTISGLLYVSIGPLLFLRVSYTRKKTTQSLWRALSEGMGYVMGNAALRSLLIFGLVMETFGFSFFIMLPVIARDILEVGPIGLGFLSAAVSGGGLAATLSLASAGDFRRKTLALSLASGSTGLALLFFSLSQWYGLSMVLASLIGASLATYDVTMNTTLQLTSTDAMRGRVLGLYGLTFGFTPLGGFINGSLAAVAGAPFALGLGGILILGGIVSILFPSRSLWRIPPVALQRADGADNGDQPQS
jgi:MFS family permease